MAWPYLGATSISTQAVDIGHERQAVTPANVCSYKPTRLPSLHHAVQFSVADGIGECVPGELGRLSPTRIGERNRRQPLANVGFDSRERSVDR